MDAFVRGYNFYVEINYYILSFARVSGLENGVSLQSVQEGGYNNAVHMLRSASDGESTLTLEYGVTEYTLLIDTLQPGRYIQNGIKISVLDEHPVKSGEHKVIQEFELDGCYVKNIRFGGLDASQSTLVINQLEIAYNGIRVIKQVN